MKTAGLKVRCKQKFRTTTNSKHRYPVAENLLGRDFTADRPNQKWVADITYLPVSEGWIYLAIVMDLFSRKIVGWAMRKTLHTELVVAALTMAQRTRRPGQGITFGTSYSSAGVGRTIWRAQYRGVAAGRRPARLRIRRRPATLTI